MLPAIPKVIGSGTFVINDEQQQVNKKDVHRVALNLCGRYSSALAQKWATQILRVTNTLLNSAQINSDDVEAFHRELNNRFVNPANAAIHCTFSSQDFTRRATQILKDTSSYLTSHQTNAHDGTELRRSLADRLISPLPESTRRNATLESRCMGKEMAFRPLNKIYQNFVDASPNYRTKQLANELMFKCILSGQEYRDILEQSRLNRCRSAGFLLDTLMTDSHLRASPEKVASVFEEVLKSKCPGLAKRLYSEG
ncbi:hypothetical protein [Endozoicomonas atrinae]|uniref:hypothetical protein n=1 Tax=Endozoicomonas atrinae TaxID=1333660 RepID=UPI000824C6DA|nr:hypothetical protein [Endozoicomonas atrinae]